jgi:hypothetical protein
MADLESVLIGLVEIYGQNGVATGSEEFLYRLLCERPALANISHVEAPAFEEHQRFVRRHPYRDWLIIQAQGKWVGSLHATQWNSIGVAILKEDQQKGYARKAVQMYMSANEPLPAIPSSRRGAFVMYAAPENGPGKALIERLGGKLIHLTYEVLVQSEANDAIGSSPPEL